MGKYYKTYDGYYAGYTIDGYTGIWFGCKVKTVSAVTHTEYRYRVRKKIYTYYFK